MSTPTQQRIPLRFFVGFGLVALLIAGLVSYLASSNPDGLDSVVLDGCTESGEQLTGDCIAQNADEHALEEGLLAGYTVGGDESLLGVSGVIGVLATLLVASGLFWLLRPRCGPDPGSG